MIINKENIELVAKNLSNFTYEDNLQATKELIELFNSISKRELKDYQDYVKMYDDHFYTYQTWEDLIKSELECADGLTEEECKEEINISIWKLPCGWYVQYV